MIKIITHVDMKVKGCFSEPKWMIKKKALMFDLAIAAHKMRNK